MSLTLHDINAARKNASVHHVDFCKAIKVVIPVLEVLASQSTGWKFWLKWGINALISALKSYTNIFCITIPAPKVDV